MKNTNKNYKILKKECNLCVANFNAWISSLNYDNSKERAMKENISNYCPVCIISDNTRHKGRL